jgi:hypothetical protein
LDAERDCPAQIDLELYEYLDLAVRHASF